jgi:hypothetical protein
VQREYLTPALYNRMSPAHHLLMDIEELPAGAPAIRAARREHAGDSWWN